MTSFAANSCFAKALSKFPEVEGFHWNTVDIVTVLLRGSLEEIRKKEIIKALKRCKAKEVKLSEPVLSSFWYIDGEPQISDEQRAAVKAAFRTLADTLSACGIYQYSSSSKYPLVARQEDTQG